MSVFTPVNQVRLTNVAYVRLTKNHKRFEIACYRNKVLNWRNKIETDINEVLQIDSIFSNVSKGMLANSKDLLSTFGTTDSKVSMKLITTFLSLTSHITYRVTGLISVLFTHLLIDNMQRNT
jgi:ribosome maturation protein SDO1